MQEATGFLGEVDIHRCWLDTREVQLLDVLFFFFFEVFNIGNEILKF